MREPCVVWNADHIVVTELEWVYEVIVVLGAASCLRLEPSDA